MKKANTRELNRYYNIGNILYNQLAMAHRQGEYAQAQKIDRIINRMVHGKPLTKSQKQTLSIAIGDARYLTYCDLNSAYHRGDLSEFSSLLWKNIWDKKETQTETQTQGGSMKTETQNHMSDEAVMAVKIRQGSIGVEPVQAIKTGDSLLVLERFISEKPNVAFGEYMTVDGFIGTIYKLADGSFSDYMSTDELDKHFADSPLSTPSIISDKADRQACIELAKLYSPLCYLTANGDYNRAEKALVDFAKSLTLHQQLRLDSMLNEYLPSDGANISSTLQGKLGVNING